MTFTIHEKGKRPRAWCVECGKPRQCDRHPRRPRVDPCIEATRSFSRWADDFQDRIRRQA